MEKNILRNKIAPAVISTGNLVRVFAIQKFSEEHFIITPEQFLVLALLVERGELYQRQIAEITLKDRPNITRIINILEKLELVKRVQESNKRMIYKIIVTDKGNEVYKIVLEKDLKIRAQIVENIPNEELEIFVKILNQIQANLINKVKLQI